MTEPLIHAAGLCKSHTVGGVTVQAVRDATLTVAKNEFVSIMGPSGSGKSTLVNLLGLLDTPSAGEYRLDGTDAGALDHDSRAALRNCKIGFVFQSFNLLARNTALENVELPLIYAGVAKNERQDRATTALEAVGLQHRLQHWPHQLSGGEQQRVSIARALVNDPSLILADEPTGALDSRTGLEVIAQLQRLNRAGRTIVMVTHNAEIARYGHRVIELGDGRITNDSPISAPLEAVARPDAAADEARLGGGAG
jgi:putative ABC transport system ATP-binding protein